MFDLNSFNNIQLNIFLLLLVVWVLPWKGIALWKSARNHHKIWFIVLLVVNTLAILDILYIFIFSKKARIDTDKTRINTDLENISMDK